MMDHESPADAPFLWWGPSGIPQPRRNLAWLVGRGMLSATAAAFLAAAVARRLSLAVVAKPSGAGKTTLLTAALAHLPADARPVYLRGRWETFAFLDDPAVRPDRQVLLVNEIGPHLPGYLWGDAVGDALEAARQGFPVYATAHAADADGLARMLASPELALPIESTSVFDLVAAIESAGGRRRVNGIWAPVSRGPGELEIVPICGGDAGLEGVAAGLRRAMRAGWAPGRNPPDADAVVRAIATLAAADDGDDLDPERPGKMLARSRSTRSNGRAQSP